MQSLRVLIAIAARFGFQLSQTDISSAYLNGKLDHDVYMEVPQGYPPEDLPKNFDRKTHFLLLKKALYGLKQGEAAWFKEFKTFLQANGFTCGKAEPCIYWFTRVINGVRELILLAVYVDDCLWACKCKSLRDQLVKRMKEHYALRDEGDLSCMVPVH